MITERSAITEPVRRIEVFTGAGRRRAWSAEDKARIVAESVAGEDSVCTVARRHGLSPQQLFGWRRAARLSAEAASAGLFVPAIVEAPALNAPPHRSAPVPRRTERAASQSRAAIELEIGGVTVRIGRDADTAAIVAVIGALKAGA